METVAGVLNWMIWTAFAVELVVMLAVVPRVQGQIGRVQLGFSGREMGLLYVCFIGIPACAVAMLAGLVLVVTGMLLTITVVFAPVGLPMIAAGMTTMMLGSRYLVLNKHQFL